MREILEPLGPTERDQLTPVLEKLLAAQTCERRDLEHRCRLCHRSACEACPVAGALR